jgi:hypothetical protein
VPVLYALSYSDVVGTVGLVLSLLALLVSLAAVWYARRAFNIGSRPPVQLELEISESGPRGTHFLCRATNLSSTVALADLTLAIEVMAPHAGWQFWRSHPRVGYWSEHTAIVGPGKRATEDLTAPAFEYFLAQDLPTIIQRTGTDGGSSPYQLLQDRALSLMVTATYRAGTVERSEVRAQRAYRVRPVTKGGHLDHWELEPAP